MNLLSLINLWLDINYQITTKCATLPKPKLFHQLNTPLVWLLKKTISLIDMRCWPTDLNNGPTTQVHKKEKPGRAILRPPPPMPLSDPTAADRGQGYSSHARPGVIPSQKQLRTRRPTRFILFFSLEAQLAIILPGRDSTDGFGISFSFRFMSPFYPVV